ncbi:MAG TPA: HNH endonuclease, partial [Clostridia bacterium]
MLTKPFFFEQDNWIYLDNWPSSIQSGKKISLNDEKGVNLYNSIQERLKEDATLYQIISNNQKRFEHYLVKQRLGQGAFRVLVTDAYNRQCAVSGEKILPALEATHIKPYSKEGPNDVKNG